LAGESDAGEVKLDDVVALALDPGPRAGALPGGVPEEGSAADSRAESEQCGSLGGQICVCCGEHERQSGRHNHEGVLVRQHW